MQTIAELDILLLTYDELQAAVRGGRGKGRAILEVQWWRVVLDEAQMVFNAASQAAVMASELWRVSGWCSTGTPMGNRLEDIHGLLVFLDQDPFADQSPLQSAVLTPYSNDHAGSEGRLSGLLSHIMWRHSKRHVEDEIDVPPVFEKLVCSCGLSLSLSLMLTLTLTLTPTQNLAPTLTL